jgi:hypothetical protein
MLLRLISRQILDDGGDIARRDPMPVSSFWQQAKIRSMFTLEQAADRFYLYIYRVFGKAALQLLQQGFAVSGTATHAGAGTMHNADL